MITESITKSEKFILEFDNFNGTGWKNSIVKTIKEKIQPEKIEEKESEVGWHYSEFEYQIEKDNLSFTLHVDDEGSRYLLLQSEISDESKSKLREWATIIAEEIEKLK